MQHWFWGQHTVCSNSTVDLYCVLCSIGSGGSTQFEDSIFERLGARTHTFDGTVPPLAAEQLKTIAHIDFHHYSLTVEGGGGKDIVTIMKELGHSFVDVFKIDCEGECNTVPYS